jgi:hypothetical protein
MQPRQYKLGLGDGCYGPGDIVEISVTPSERFEIAPRI